MLVSLHLKDSSLRYTTFLLEFGSTVDFFYFHATEARRYFASVCVPGGLQEQHKTRSSLQCLPGWAKLLGEKNLEAEELVGWRKVRWKRGLGSGSLHFSWILIIKLLINFFLIFYLSDIVLVFFVFCIFLFLFVFIYLYKSAFYNTFFSFDAKLMLE